MTPAKKRLEMLLLQQRMADARRTFNERLLKLRRRKLALLAAVAAWHGRLRQIAAAVGEPGGLFSSHYWFCYCDGCSACDMECGPFDLGCARTRFSSRDGECGCAH